MKNYDKKIKLSVTKSHKTREMKQENIILKGLVKILDNKKEDWEKSRAKFKDTLLLLMKVVKSSEKRYMDLYDESPDLYRTINTDGIILNCNRSYAERLGYSKEEIIGKTILDHSAEGDLQKIKDSFETWKRKGSVKNREIWLKCKDGSIFPGLLAANNLYDEENKLIGSVTAIKDITEIYEYRKKLEESSIQIQHQLEELKKTDAEKNDFLAMITHELKTPLVPIKSYIDMILSQKLGLLNDTQKERLRIVRSSTMHLLKLVTDLLDAQKIELGQLKLTKERCDLAKIVSNIVEKMREEISKKNMSITTNLEKNVFCFCDPMRIEQVLTNLLVNAIKFSIEGSGKISVKLYSKNDQGRIVVKDNGIGIVEDKLKKIFVKFYQVDSSSTREYGGTGLGLSVCKGLIENHGGKIWAESEGRNKGAEIHIRLPLIK